MGYFVSCVRRGMLQAMHEIFWVLLVAFLAFIIIEAGARPAHAALYPAAKPFGDTSYLAIPFMPSATVPNFTPVQWMPFNWSSSPPNWPPAPKVKAWRPPPTPLGINAHGLY